MSNPFRYFNSSPEVIRLVVMMYVRYPLSLRNVEDLLTERGIDISQEMVRFSWNRFDPMFAADIRKKRVAHMHGYPRGPWHLDEVFVKVNEMQEAHARLPAVLIVSADPAADTPANVKCFLAEVSLTGRVQYLTGTAAQLRSVWRAYDVKPASVGAHEFDVECAGAAARPGWR